MRENAARARHPGRVFGYDVLSSAGEAVLDQRRGGGDAGVGTRDQGGRTVAQVAATIDEGVVGVAEARPVRRVRARDVGHRGRGLRRSRRSKRRRRDQRQADNGSGDEESLLHESTNPFKVFTLETAAHSRTALLLLVGETLTGRRLSAQPGNSIVLQKIQ